MKSSSYHDLTALLVLLVVAGHGTAAFECLNGTGLVVHVCCLPLHLSVHE